MIRLLVLSLWLGLSAASLPILNCTSEVRAALKRRFYETFQGDGSKCPQENLLYATMYRADPTPDDKFAVSVGTNKGYDVVHFLGLWGTVSSDVLTFNSWAMLLSKMHNYGRTVDDHICGECKECLERFRIQPSDLPQRLAAPLPNAKRKRKHRHWHMTFPYILAIDSNIKNIHSLQRIQSAYSLPVWPMIAYVGNTTAPDVVELPPCEWGHQHCPLPLEPNRTKGVSVSEFSGFGFGNSSSPADDEDHPQRVPQHTLSSIFYELGINGTVSTRKDISLLLVHTEGTEDQVLIGARPLLRAGRVRVVVFSYHPVRWDSKLSLGDHVAWISQNMGEPGGGACYLLGKLGVWKITRGCWDPLYQKHPSTIACVRQGDVWESAIDGLAVRHRPATAAMAGKGVARQRPG